MNIAILTEHAHARPAAETGQWPATIARHLAERGHHVTVLAEGVTDPTIFAVDRVELVVRDTRSRGKTRRPRTTAGWLRRQHDRLAPDATLSMTPLAPGDAFCPVGLTAGDELARSLARGGPLSKAFELIQRPYLPAALVIEHNARRRAPTPITLGPASLLTCITDDNEPARAAHHRRTLRTALDIAPDEPTFAISTRQSRRDDLDTVLRAIAALAHENQPVRLLAVGARVVSLCARAAAIGVHTVVPLEATARPDAVFDAADAALIPSAPTRTYATGRFGADAIRRGTPIASHPRAVAADLLNTAAAPGIRLPESPTVESWITALRTLADAAQRDPLTAAAHAIAPSLSPDATVDRIESALRAAAD